MAGILAWIASHSSIVSGFAVAIIDLIFALNPKTQSSGILHYILLLLGLTKLPPVPPVVMPK